MNSTERGLVMYAIIFVFAAGLSGWAFKSVAVSVLIGFGLGLLLMTLSQILTELRKISKLLEGK